MVSQRDSLLIATAISVVLTPILYIGARIIFLPSLQQSVFEMTGVWMRNNPFRNLYFLVGLLGGAIAGYLSEPRWQAGCVNGLSVGLFTGISIYLIVLIYNISMAFLADGPIAFYVIAVVPLIYVFPILLVFPLEGGLTGTVIAWLRTG